MSNRIEKMFGREMAAKLKAECERVQSYAEDDWRKAVGAHLPEFWERVNKDPCPEGLTEEEYVAQLKDQWPALLYQCKAANEELIERLRRE